jgi:hypothetical protein
VDATSPLNYAPVTEARDIEHEVAKNLNINFADDGDHEDTELKAPTIYNKADDSEDLYAKKVNLSQETPEQSSQKMLKVLKFGAGGDDQSHVTRPKTAVDNSKATRTLNRVNSELETITEKQKEEDILAASQGIELNRFEIDESHSFSLRNFPHGKSS